MVPILRDMMQTDIAVGLFDTEKCSAYQPAYSFDQKAKPGDLVFFATAGGTKVSHVGIIHTINPNGEVTFIHSSTSKGVIISTLNEKYWNKAYLFVKRVL